MTTPPPAGPAPERVVCECCGIERPTRIYLDPDDEAVDLCIDCCDALRSVNACQSCWGTGVAYTVGWDDLEGPPCDACKGTGTVPSEGGRDGEG